MKIQLMSLLIVFSLFQSVKSDSQSPVYPIPHPKGYVCFKSKTPINIDGYLNEADWEQAQWSEVFMDITGDETVKPYLETKVKILWDDNYLYIAAELEEDHLWGTITERDQVIFKDNDFEVFIDPNGDNHHYYELELNVLNTVWDLLMTKPYRNGGSAIDNYDFNGLLTGVATYGTIDEPNDIDEKWTVEIAIPWHNFEVWNTKRNPKVPYEGEQWRMNFSRVQWELDRTPYSYTKKLDFRRNPLPESNWVWSPQGVIQMHQPETWGYLQFSEKYVGTAEVDFKLDLDFNLKMALMDTYFQQKIHFKKHQTYAKSIENLKLSEYNKLRFADKLKIETLHNRFIVFAKGYNGVWQIDESSQITLIPNKLE